MQTETGLGLRPHEPHGKTYMATEQAGYALAAYERFLAGQPALYTMTDTTYGTHTCVRYRDTARHWAQPYVCAVTEQGLMNGVGNDCFDPEGTLNRAMLATVLWRASGSPAAEGGSFSDVPAGQWYSTAVSWAQQSGIVQGVGENRFAPDGQHHARAARRYALARLRQPREHAEPCSLPGCRDVLRLGEHCAGVGCGARHSERHGRQTGPRRHGDASAGSGHADALSAVRVLP